MLLETKHRDSNLSQRCVINYIAEPQTHLHLTPPRWKSMFSSPGCREVSKYTVEKLGNDFKFGHHALEGTDTIITSLVLAFSDGFLS